MATPCGWVISMAISGLGFLVLTWTTVVLLGGFVSELHKEDFWCAAFITLVQTAGIFDVTLNEKLGYMEDALLGFLAAISFGIVPYDAPSKSCTQDLLSFLLFFSVILLVLVQVMVLALILSPLAIIYVLGIFMSGVISLWRLVEHDHGGNSDEKASNLAPAMQILYCLALLQGVLFCYRFLLTLTEKKFSKTLVTEDSEVQAVLYNYLRKTRRGCEKDPTFTQGRNLVTYAVDKIGSNSPVDSISGVKILYAAVCMVESKNDWSNVHGQRMLIKHLVLSTSSSRNVLPKLLEMLDSRGLHDRRGRIQAAMIVERLAFYINLEQFPRSIQHISSLIGTFEQYSIAEPYPRSKDGYEQHLKLQVTRGRPSPAGELGKAYKELLLQGLSILRNLAADENNCRIMSNTRDLVSKIMAPVTCDLLDHTTDDHGTWCEVVGRSMEVMSHLSGAQGETGSKLRREISSCGEAIRTLRRILSCKKCKEELRQRAIWILTRLYTDTTGISGSFDFHLLKKENSCCGEDFVRMLVNIFTQDNEYSSSIRGYAGEALSNICFLGGISDATIIIQTSGDVIDSLTQVLLHEENETCRQASAEILECLCTHYTKDDEYLHKLKKAILKVIGKILCCGDGTHNGEDIESQCDGTQENNEPNKDAQGFQVNTLSTMSPNLLSSLLCLCGTVYNTSSVIDLRPQLDASSFLNNLRDMVVKRSGPTVENLSVCKAAGNMVISMLKY
ncbi:hypothetical protein CFC21_004520 [Triticum aestivum]|uniref:Uncharacterized protein n=1 Tax=Triticum aestivum TaxID=4565 RepID=A0A3B6U8Z6_WHEAT|nr:uncharacterized protein LOC119294988 isoform X1 [Triticum dicoccoides]XP_037429203.1 uncharacterized protein LOC119294988 isoform X1 [Triticum dicoccoides]XP_044349964.1 uncharacterized protein LOC123070725 isoform X1 [Triticum aestivum]XP_044349971.1 uncharacterized protein LOC123070725 isoform X1 [Triticum aestivum]KAF6986800.1 hypothetical protein CFC21_004520 [Triticum aestivum]